MKKWLEPDKMNKRYFVDESDKTIILVGVNLCFFRNTDNLPDSLIIKQYEKWINDFARNGGNFIRIWLSVPFFDVMPDKIGEYRNDKLENIQHIVRLAEKHGIKIKFTLEHFRRIEPKGKDAESFPGVVDFNKPLYSDVASNMTEYLNSDKCKQIYLAKARFLANSGIGDSPMVVAWELWNEINCIGSTEILEPWSDYMIKELKQIFPRQMILQNLGSFSASETYKLYDYLATVKDNAFLQVHRYLDPGAALDNCRAPVDILCADSIRELLKRKNDCPVILAEGGAVEANHSKYSDLYEMDTEGTMLHDIIFAPFFSGSAGCGQCWHWDHLYINKHDLWYHFNRFSTAIKGIDPIAECFTPFYTETHNLRIYGLKGKTADLLWCRDKASSWESELKQGVKAKMLTDEKIPVSQKDECECYLPWEDKHVKCHVNGGWCELPVFKRSIILRLYNCR